jgi:hypothetical protein
MKHKWAAIKGARKRAARCDSAGEHMVLQSAMRRSHFMQITDYRTLCLTSDCSQRQPSAGRGYGAARIIELGLKTSHDASRRLQQHTRVGLLPQRPRGDCCCMPRACRHLSGTTRRTRQGSDRSCGIATNQNLNAKSLHCVYNLGTAIRTTLHSPAALQRSLPTCSQLSSQNPKRPGTRYTGFCKMSVETIYC